MPTIHQLLQSYRSYLSRKGAGKDTVSNYLFYLARFVKHANVRGLEDITSSAIGNFRSDLSRLRNRRGGVMKQSTQNCHLIALRSFIEYLRREHGMPLDCGSITLKKTGGAKKQPLEKTDLERLLEAPMQAKKTSAIHRRDRALLELLFTSGLKVSEISKLSKNDMGQGGDTIAIRGTGGRVRGVPLTHQAHYWIKEYLTVRTDRFPALFLRHDRARQRQLDSIEKNAYRLTPRTIQRIIKKYAASAGLSPHVSPQSLRDAHTAELLARGADISMIQAQLGFTSREVAQQYAKRIRYG
ncbi:MAG: tyrosine-type recombinase/integrase [Patescibacteria group bacterium]